MDIVIDIQGFRDVEENFIPKEVTVLAEVLAIINAAITGHWIMTSPCPFKDLPVRAKRENNVWSEPIKSWASIERTNQNTPFNYPITPSLHSSTNQNAPFLQTDPSRPRPRRRRETWRGFVLPHGCPYTT
ncbi:hypothetical protein ALC56_03931 [Trachymyrmex septentrionalis]|uniref:Uncharacterized protein n=1 Tax=Trachymyrmex septentrionalis TaxID=34720 RepID=A0A151JZ70_9HYME|nr:hypothetical protein ALC56_03931 [Trachymyrmex septentrionalis]